MKESSDDIITKRIKEVLEQFEPDYSPQFWEKIRKQRPVPESLLITLLLRYKFWLSVLVISGILFIVSMLSDLLPADQTSDVNPFAPESLSYSVSDKVNETTDSEKTTSSGYSISYYSIAREERKITSRDLQASTTDPMPVLLKQNIPDENTIAGRPESIENNSGFLLLPDEAYFGSYFKALQLIPIEFRTEDVKLLKGQEHDNIGRLEFHWPDFHSLITNEEGYARFVGPNKAAFFYSPEIHFSDSLKTIGLSQGAGISFEGAIRSLVSVSVGLSYQAINFSNKTIFLGKVPPPGPFEPSDTISTFYYIDSIGIRSGSYKFIELPIFVNYKFMESTRSQVWLGAGISSIAFLRQEYTYETIVEEVSEAASSISVKAWENLHPLASVNFSLLYRYKYSDRFLLQASVQYKQHLSGLGYNSMKLNRLNLQIGLIYRFGRED